MFPQQQQQHQHQSWQSEEPPDTSRPFVVCIVDDFHVVQLSSQCPIYMCTRGHQDILPFGSARFRFMAVPTDLTDRDHFDTLVWDDEQEIDQLLERASGRWVDVTKYACSMDVIAAQTGLEKWHTNERERACRETDGTA
jgi:hypothetical protein